MPGGHHGGGGVGGRLDDATGLTRLICLGALATAACWLIVPLVRLDRREQASD